ncbi:RICIN domain-containing protein [Actinacidiphila oryziradicis]|uniref:RICIN domain-containing protein n=1 Tax=Actinacidiphila oryziradicis TaxID=2571141 RepID=UPI0023F0B5CB|nr:RICIN domain-containing protein [Actinacidiphila oryziradicis]MCW2872216.1 glycosyl hydrolase [Actinacidiphila oryziradicis]
MAPQTPPGSDEDSSAEAARALDARREAARAALGRAVAREESAAEREHRGVAGDRPPSEGDDNTRPRRRLSDTANGTLGVAAVAVLTVLAALTVAFVALNGSHGKSSNGSNGRNSRPVGAASGQSTPVGLTGSQVPVAAGPATGSPSASPATVQPDTRPSPAAATAPPHTSVPASAPPRGALVVQASGKCLSSDSGAGAQATVAACDGSASQRWTFATDRTLRSAGLCLNVSGGATDDRTPITLATCDASGPQLFRLTSAHTLVAERSSKCVDEFGGASGTLAVLWECNGRDNQHWTLS